MPERLGRALNLLQSVALPADLADNPAQTNQWLATLTKLQQVLALLQTCAEEESRAMQCFRRFQRLTEGLPIACLAGLPATAKLGLLRPVIAELEAKGSSLDLPGTELGMLRSRLRQYGAALSAMAVRQQTALGSIAS